MTNKYRLLGLGLLLTLLTTACLPKGVRVPQSDLLKAFERKAGLIAYLGTDGNIYTVDQSGSKPTPVTTDAHSDSDYLVYGFPVWSPDSDSLAFAGFSGQQSQAPEKVSLFVAGKDGKNVVEAYSSENDLIYYYWSPDSGWVSFLADTPSRSLALKIVSSSGGDAETVDVGSPYYWTWSPDSHAVLIHAGGATADSRGRLSILRLDETVTEEGLEITPALFKAPAYSPDGSQMLVAGETAPGKSALLLTDASGSSPQTVAEYEGNIAFVWSPNGKLIAYIAGEVGDQGFAGHLTVVDPAGKRKPVVLQAEAASAFFWSPDSKSIAYFTPKVVELPTPEPGKPSGNRPQSFIAWSLSVMDAQSGNTHAVVPLFIPTERFLQVLPYFDQYHQSLTIWSPDSKNLVVSAYNGGADPGIWIVAASGNLEPRFIAPGLVGFWSWK